MFGVRKDKKDESNDKLLRRFKRGMKEARYLLFMKKSRYHKRSLRKREIRNAALSRDRYREIRRKQSYIS